MNKNEKNYKLRVFFWLVPLQKGRYRRPAPYADVPETLGLRGGPKTAKNGQKWPKMTRGRKSIKPTKIAKSARFCTMGQIWQNRPKTHN